MSASQLPEGASAPLILLDALPMGMRIEVWRRKHDASHPDFAWATVRLGELIRSFDPKRSLTLADEAESLGADREQVAAVRSAALLELNRPADAASHILVLPAGPQRSLHEARVHLLEDRLEEGLRALDALLSTPDLPVDIHAEALSFRARAHPADGVEGALADLAELEQLCIREQATLTGMWIGLWRTLVRSEGWATAARVLSAGDLARKLTELTAGVEVEPGSLGPIPLHVHAVFVRYREDPRRAVEELITLAGLFWQSGLHAEAHKTAVYGRRIGARLLGGKAAKDLSDYEAVLRRHAGEERWAELSRGLDDEERASAGPRS